jgi:hypothetical protein
MARGGEAMKDWWSCVVSRMLSGAEAGGGVGAENRKECIRQLQRNSVRSGGGGPAREGRPLAFGAEKRHSGPSFLNFNLGLSE